MTKTFMDTFVFMGGAGTGISLAGAILFGKTQASRKIGIFRLCRACSISTKYCCSACLSCSIRLC
ncbi:MAG: hypothetical protein ACLU4B_00400 [Bilophila wadsworthia]